MIFFLTEEHIMNFPKTLFSYL